MKLGKLQKIVVELLESNEDGLPYDNIKNNFDKGIDVKTILKSLKEREIITSNNNVYKLKNFSSNENSNATANRNNANSTGYDFSEYNNMPVKVTKKRNGIKVKENKWFDNYINDLRLECDGLVYLLTENNRDTIERDIEENESYNAKFTEKIYEYYCFKNDGTFPRDSTEAITDLIKMIDLENSTNMWRYKKNRPLLKNMVSFIVENRNSFWSKIEQGDKNIVDELKDAAGSDTDGPKSLASKICKYFCGLFFNDAARFNYYINDTVVRHVLPFYLNYYGFKFEKDKNTRTYFDNLKYEELYNYLEWLKDKIESDNQHLKRGEIDHIMWYCYRYESMDESEEE